MCVTVLSFVLLSADERVEWRPTVGTEHVATYEGVSVESPIPCYNAAVDGNRTNATSSSHQPRAVLTPSSAPEGATVTDHTRSYQDSRSTMGPTSCPAVISSDHADQQHTAAYNNNTRRALFQPPQGGQSADMESNGHSNGNNTVSEQFKERGSYSEDKNSSTSPNNHTAGGDGHGSGTSTSSSDWHPSKTLDGIPNILVCQSKSKSNLLYFINMMVIIIIQIQAVIDSLTKRNGGSIIQCNCKKSRCLKL